MNTRPIVNPVEQTTSENRVRPCNTLWSRDGVADLAHVVRVRNVEHADAVSVPRDEYQVLEYRRVVVLPRQIAARFTVAFARGSLHAVRQLVLLNAVSAQHHRECFGFDG